MFYRGASSGCPFSKRLTSHFKHFNDLNNHAYSESVAYCFMVHVGPQSFSVAASAVFFLCSISRTRLWSRPRLSSTRPLSVWAVCPPFFPWRSVGHCCFLSRLAWPATTRLPVRPAPCPLPPFTPIPVSSAAYAADACPGRLVPTGRREVMT